MTNISSSVSVMFYLTALTWLLVIHGAQASAGRGPDGTEFHGEQKNVPAIFTFGDSIVDAGTNSFLSHPAFAANFSPYGETYLHEPTGRFSDGRIWVDRLAQYLGLPLPEAYLNPNITDYTQGIDFASAGSGNFQAVKDTIELFSGGGQVVNTDEQLLWFAKVKASLIDTLGENATEELLGRSIFVLSTGSNDLSWGYALDETLRELYTIDEFTSLMIESIYTTTKILYDSGARKIVLSSLGPIGCLPTIAGGNDGMCVEYMNDWVKLFNSKLPALLQWINTVCLDARVVYTDQYDVVEGFITNGTEHGFTKGTQACCGIGKNNGRVGGCGARDPNGTATYNLCTTEELQEYVFWDYAHPTEKTYGILADLFINGQDVIKPYNISQLVHSH